MIVHIEKRIIRGRPSLVGLGPLLEELIVLDCYRVLDKHKWLNSRLRKKEMKRVLEQYRGIKHGPC
jgi:hypothetical protein